MDMALHTKGSRMTLTLAEMQRVVAELNDTVKGAHIQKIHQPGDKTVVLQVRVPGATHQVSICADRSLARIHLLSQPLKNPPSPPQFCMVLRKHLVPSRIDSIELLSHDRVVRISLEAGKDGGTIMRSLILEAIPGCENIILADEQNRIIEALEHAAFRDGRQISPHRPYSPPPAVEHGAQAMDDRFEQPLREQHLPTYSAAIEQAYGKAGAEQKSADLVRDVSTVLARNEKRMKRRLEKIEADFEATNNSDLIALKGELLKANLDNLKRGMDKVALPNTISGTNELIEIELDATLPPLENMKRYFKRARKLRDGRAIISARMGETRAALARITRTRERLKEASTLDELQQIAKEVLSSARRAVRGEPAPQVRLEPRRFVSADGMIILVGRNPAQNDDITLHAHGNDYWLHVQSYPGSHVIIKLDKDKPLMKETLLDAAHLAMYFSKLRDSSKALIDYTQRKNVRKPKGMPPGKVIYSQHKTMMLLPDKHRLDRLLKKHEGGD